MKMKRIIAFICMSILLLSFTGCKSPLEGGQPDAEVASNGGLAAVQGDWIYYINGGMPANLNESLVDSEQATIWRMKKDGTQKARISQRKAFDFYIYNDTIFFITPTSASLDVYAVKIDGTKEKKVTNFDDQGYYDFGENGMAFEKDAKIVYVDYETRKASTIESGDVAQVLVRGDYIYYYMTNKAAMTRVHIDGTGEESLASTIGYILYADNVTMYFAFNMKTLYKVDINTLELTQITNSTYSDIKVNPEKNIMAGLDATEDTIGLYIMPLDGSAVRTKIYGKNAGAFYMGQDYIFFADSVTNDLYRCNYDGSEITKLCNVSLGDENSLDEANGCLYIRDSSSPAGLHYIPVTGGSLLTLNGEDAA